jgi:hydrogenase-4 membrane subunit HyfE
MVEMGVLLDMFVGIFVSCIIISKINQSFASMDTRILSSLKE